MTPFRGAPTMCSRAAVTLGITANRMTACAVLLDVPNTTMHDHD